MTETRDEWKVALAAGPQCIPLERLDAALTEAETQHVASCARCTAELALFREYSGDIAAHEKDDVSWIASELRRRAPASASVRPFTPRPRLTMALRIAAALLIGVVALGVYLATREPSVDDVSSITTTYRSTRIEAIAPRGDVTAPPTELRWTAAAGVINYEVEVLEVDQTQVWRARAETTHIALPPEVVAKFAPAKTIIWRVRGMHDRDVVADSGTQQFRVQVQ